VQMMRPIGAMPTGRHNVSSYRQHRSRPCKKRKDGAPTVSKREAKNPLQSPGHPSDNGDVFVVTNNLDTQRSQSFTYDALNRLVTGQSSATSGSKCWGETYTVDPWGNLTSITPSKCSAETLSAQSTTLNQVLGYCYDKGGNLLGTTGCPSLPYVATYTYDAENRLSAFAGITYTYDGDGKRVKKSNGTLYWGAGPLAESDLSGTMQSEYIYLNGERIARRDTSNSSVHYVYSDFLGSSSVITTSSGSLPAEQDVDYFPYGGLAYGTSSNHYLFTGKERDSESGLDNFEARYYASNRGRFMTPDWAARPTAVPYAVFGDPQSLNLYGYVRNDPVSRADLDGHAGNQACSENKLTNHPGGQGAQTATTCSQAEKDQSDGAQNQSQKQTQSNQQQTPQRGLTVGVGVAGNVDVGVVKAGAETNATLVGTASISSSGKPSVGVAASGAAVAYAGDHVAAAPKQETKPLVAGAYGGGGVTFIVANTANSKGLSGPFQTISGNVGGGQGASVALSFDHHGTFVLQLTLGPGLGVSGWAVTTNTKAGCAGGSACE